MATGHAAFNGRTSASVSSLHAISTSERLVWAGPQAGRRNGGHMDEHNTTNPTSATGPWSCPRRARRLVWQFSSYLGGQRYRVWTVRYRRARPSTTYSMNTSPEKVPFRHEDVHRVEERPGVAIAYGGLNPVKNIARFGTSRSIIDLVRPSQPSTGYVDQPELLQVCLPACGESLGYVSGKFWGIHRFCS